MKISEELQQRLVNEIKQLLSNAEYEDGQAICLTQDCEVLENILKEIGE